MMKNRFSTEGVVMGLPESQWDADEIVRDPVVVAYVTEGPNKGKHKYFDGIHVYRDLPFIGSGGGAAAWGSITGTLSSQTDLATALDGKVDKSAQPKVFSGLVQQSDDIAPFINQIYKNDFAGDPTTSYQATGGYYINFPAGSFVLGKTALGYCPGAQNVGFAGIAVSADDQILLQTRNISGDFADSVIEDGIVLTITYYP